MDGEHAVWIARIDLQPAVLDQFDRQTPRVVERHNLVVVALKNNRRDSYRLQKSSVWSVSEKALMPS